MDTFGALAWHCVCSRVARFPGQDVPGQMMSHGDIIMTGTEFLARASHEADLQKTNLLLTGQHHTGPASASRCHMRLACEWQIHSSEVSLAWLLLL